MEAIWIVPPVAMSLLLLFYAQLSINYEFYFENKKMLILASVGSALINVVLNVVFITIIGYYVAGYTTLFSYLMFAVTNYCAMKKILHDEGINFNWIDVKKLIIIFVVFSVIGFSGMALYKLLYIRIIISIIVLGLIIIKLPKIKRYWYEIKEE